MSPPTLKTPMLRIELVPASCRYANLRALFMRRDDWTRIELALARQNFSRCRYCGDPVKFPPQMHEVWTFDDRTSVQTFTGFELLCSPCHEVKHIGLAFAKGRATVATTHFAKVSKQSFEWAKAHVLDAFQAWEVRSARAWTTDLSRLGAETFRDVGMLFDLAFAAECEANKCCTDPQRHRLQFMAAPSSLVPAQEENH